MATTYRCTACGATVTLPFSDTNETFYCPQCEAQLSPKARLRNTNKVGLGMIGGLFALIALVFLAVVTLAVIMVRNTVPPPVVMGGSGQEVVIHGPRNAPKAPFGKDDFPNRNDKGMFKEEPKAFPPAPPVPPPPPKFNDNGKADPLPLPVPPRVVDHPPPMMPVAPVVKKADGWKLPDVPKLTLQPTTLKEPTTLTLPEAPFASAIGGGGRYWVLATRNKGLFVYDLTTGKQLATIALEAQVRPEALAASNNKIALVWRNVGTSAWLSTYDLTTGKADKTIQLPSKNNYTLALGSGSDGPLFAADIRELTIFDLATLVQLPHEPLLENNPFQRVEQTAHLATNFDGRVVAFAADNKIQVFTLDATQCKPMIRPIESYNLNQIRLSHDGQRFYSHDRGYLPLDLVQANVPPKTRKPNVPPRRNTQLPPLYIPAIDGPYFVRLDKDARAGGRETENMDLHIFKFDGTTSQYQHDNIFATVPNNVAHGGDGYMLHGYLHFSVETKVAVFATLGNPNVTIVPLKFDAETPKK